MDDSAPLYHQWYGVRGAGVEVFPLPVLQHQYPDLPDHCNGCGASFDIFHALDCKK